MNLNLRVARIFAGRPASRIPLATLCFVDLISLVRISYSLSVCGHLPLKRLELHRVPEVLVLTQQKLMLTTLLHE